MVSWAGVTDKPSIKDIDGVITSDQIPDGIITTEKIATAVITALSPNEDELESIILRKGFIKEVESFGSASEFISEEILAKKLAENPRMVEKTKQIMVWTEGNAGLNALSRFLKELFDVEYEEIEIHIFIII